MTEGGETAGRIRVESAEVARQRLERGLDAEHVEHVAQAYARLMYERLAEPSGVDPSETVVRTLVQFHDAVVAREADRRVVLKTGYVIADDAFAGEPMLIVLHDHGERLVPTFQLDSSLGRPRPDVVEINAQLGALDDPWAVAIWWCRPSQQLDGRSPSESLLEGDVAAVRQLVDNPLYSY
jgi:hypothetical protein